MPSRSGKPAVERQEMQAAKLAFSSRHKTPTLVIDEKKRKREGPRKPMRFRSLHHHSTYSYLDGFQLPAAHVRRAAELSMDSLAMTEHGNMASHVKFEEAAEKEGIKPIFGVELYCGEVGENATQKKNHLTVLAGTQEGYANLLGLVSRSFDEGFYYEPTVSGAMLERYKSGLVVLSGCQSSLPATSLAGGKHISPRNASLERGRGVARRFKRSFGDNYYLEVQAFPQLELTCQINQMVEQISRELDIPIVATMDCHYTVPTEREMQKILHNIRPGEKRTLEDLERDWGYAADLCPPVSDKILLKRLIETGLSREAAIEAIINSEEIAQRCNVRLPRLPMTRFPLNGKDSLTYWREEIKKGWHERGLENLNSKERQRYMHRLKREMRIIESKDFIDYFLIVSDAVRWAKDADIAVGPSMGSAAASLVCYLLRITEIDPMLYDQLVFERFIDKTREDLPDIDIDFCKERRDEVRQYLAGKYGEECVTNVGTFTTFKARLSLDDAARVYKIPQFEVNTVKELLIERSSGDLRASATIEDTVDQFPNAGEVFERFPQLWAATELEGNVKGFGTHAGGLVISNGPIEEVASVIRRKIKDEEVTVVAMDKYDAERQNLLKLDFLGLATMTMLAECCRQVGMSVKDMYDVPLDDPEVIDAFKRNDIIGVFQFEGRAVRLVNAGVQPDNFLELCDIVALARPGPLHNGSTNAYIDIKKGARKPDVFHPALEPITRPTKYQIVYQEQILRIVREIGAFDWTHAAYIRRIISRKLGDQEFNRQGDRFREGAQRLHPDMARSTVDKIWGDLITAGSYAYNYAHSVSYATIAYWTMWFKVHHDLVFYAASLAKMPRPQMATNPKAAATTAAKLDRHTILLRDAKAHEIEVAVPDLFDSDVNWTPQNGWLHAGFQQIDGIGEKMGKVIVKAREELEIDDWEDLQQVKGIGPKTIEKMIAWIEQDDPFDIDTLDNLLSATKQELRWLKLPMPTHTASEIPVERGRDVECIWMGVVVHRNLRDIFEQNRARKGVELKPEEISRPDLNESAILAGYDGTDLVTLRVNRYRYPAMREAVWNLVMHHDVVLVKGIKPGYTNNRELLVKELYVIENDELAGD